MIGASEVLAVFRFLQPSALAIGFAGLLALGLSTVALVSHIAVVGDKEDVAMAALTFTVRVSHGPESPQAHDLGDHGDKKVNNDENDAGRRLKKEDGDQMVEKKTEGPKRQLDTGGSKSVSERR